MSEKQLLSECTFSGTVKDAYRVVGWAFEHGLEVESFSYCKNGDLLELEIFGEVSRFIPGDVIHIYTDGAVRMSRNVC